MFAGRDLIHSDAAVRASSVDYLKELRHDDQGAAAAARAAAR